MSAAGGDETQRLQEAAAFLRQRVDAARFEKIASDWVRERGAIEALPPDEERISEDVVLCAHTKLGTGATSSVYAGRSRSRGGLGCPR